MLRRLCVFLAALLACVTFGCTNSDDQLPSAPPPPAPGAIKPGAGGGAPQGLPANVMEKLKRKREDDAAKEAASAKTPGADQPAPTKTENVKPSPTKDESAKSEVPKK